MTVAADAPRDRSQWRYALILTFSLRVVYSLVAVLFGLTQSPSLERIHSNALTENLTPPDHSLHYLLLGIWQRFDTLWYLHIAERGYQHPASVVFFPLYPALIKALSWIISPTAAALLIATVAAFVLFCGLQRLWSEDYGELFVRPGVLFCALWPGSFVLFAGYTESLVFALIVWSLVLARRQRWVLAAALGSAAALTKAVGVVVVVPLIVMAIRQKKSAALAVLLIPLGPAAFWEYLHRNGDLTFTVAYGEYWRTIIAPPWTTLWHAITQLSPRALDGMLIFNLGILLFVAFLAAASRERAEYRLYALAAILMFLCKETRFPLQSMIRYLLIIFPAYAGLARFVQRPWLQERFAMVGAVMFALNLTLFWLFLDWWLVV